MAPSFTPPSSSTWQSIHGGSSTMVLHCDSCCQVHLRLRRCTATASAVGTDLMPRASVTGEPTSDETLTPAAHRVRMSTYALMHTHAILPTDFCSPVQQASAEHVPVSLARPTGSSRAHRSSSLQRGERCFGPLPSCCGGGSHAGFAVTALLLLKAGLHGQNLVRVLRWCFVCDVCMQ